VEDEDSVRVILSTMLRRQGYRVIEARNGEAALELWPGVRSEVDLLLTDMIMPQGVSGHDLAQRLAAEKPQLKIIYSSGYSSDVFRGDVVLPQGVAFLHKPYRAEVLLQTIRHSLDCVISS
jgi:CheY-like chemotaxis protein